MSIDPHKIHTKSRPRRMIRSQIFHVLSRFPNIFILYKATAMIMVWCGIWGLLDNYVFPDNPFLRYASCLILGLFFLYIDDGSIDELADINPARYKKDTETEKKED